MRPLSVVYSFCIIFSWSAAVVFAGDQLATAPKALFVPKNIRIVSSGPRADIWAGLNLQEKTLAYYLIRAAEAGRPLLFIQSHRHALTIEKFFADALDKKNVRYTRSILGDGFSEFLNYAALFDDLHGPYSVANRKMVMQTVTSHQIEKLFVKFAANINKSARDEIIRLLTDPYFEVLHHPETKDGIGLENCGTNMYEKGITAQELNRALASGLEIDLNSRVIRSEDGQLVAQPQAINVAGVDDNVKRALINVSRELKSAMGYALSLHQKRQFELMIRYLYDGHIEDFRNLNIEWVKDKTHSRVDLAMGWTETYMDHLTQIGTWESYVQILDKKLTAEALKLAQQAQYFEDKMPYGKFKKVFPSDYAPPAILANWFHEVALSHYSGFNLPNYDDIRVNFGAKNSIRVRPSAERTSTMLVSLRQENVAEFTADAVRSDTVDGYFDARNVLVLLHEIIGHGSGTYDAAKYAVGEHPARELGAYGSALEEQRADLAALVFIDDPKLVEIGLYSGAAEAERVKRAAYNGYLAEFLATVALEQSFTESHSRGRLLFINSLLSVGAIALENKDGSPNWQPENVVLAVKDYDRFKKVAYDMLAELQDIKANRKESDLATLIETRAPLGLINETWVQSIIKRGEVIEVNTTAIDQPWHIGYDLTVKTEGDMTVKDSVSKRLQACAVILAD
jgi:dipeptidyl-peptidase III